MRVLITGATGFIGSEIVAKFVEAGFAVICCGRDTRQINRRFPSCQALSCDFNQDTQPQVWLERLKQIDVVVNCAGIMHASANQSFDAVHSLAPQALFKACEMAGVKQIFQISALGADSQANNEFARSKAEADAFVINSSVNATVLRPSLVYANGSYGGTSLFRGLAGLPGIIPLPGRGDFQFQPIFASDLAEVIIRLVKQPPTSNQIINVVGPEPVSIKQFIQLLRTWMGFSSAWYLPIPLFLILFFARMGDLFTRGPINSNSLAMLTEDNIADVSPLIAATSVQPRTVTNVLETHPSNVQDRWHARLYFLKPLLRLSIALLWILSGVFSLTIGKSHGTELLASANITGFLSGLIIYLFGFIDILIGIAVLLRWRFLLMCWLQIVLIVAYTVVGSILVPSLWADPLGPLLKNIVIVVAILVMSAME